MRNSQWHGARAGIILKSPKHPVLDIAPVTALFAPVSVNALKIVQKPIQQRSFWTHRISAPLTGELSRSD